MTESLAAPAAGAAPRARLLPGTALLWVLPAVYLVDVILGGPVGLLPGLRFALFGAACASLLGLLLVAPRLNAACLPPMLFISAFMLLNYTWATFIPVLQGGSVRMGLEDARGYMALVLPILFMAAAGQRTLHFRRLQLLVVWASFVLALLQIAIWIVGTMMPDLQGQIRFGAMLLLRSTAVFVGPMPDGFFRVFWICSLWFLPAWFWTRDVVAGSGRRNVVAAVLLMGIFVTYSRGIWLGLAAGWALATCIRAIRDGPARHLGRQVLALGGGGVLLAIVLAASGHTDIITERALGRSASGVLDGSFSERIEQSRYLMDVWSRNPFLGGGYGAHSREYIRADEAPYTYENVPYALLAKLGIVGLLLYGAFFVVVGVSTLLRSRRSDAAGAGGAGLLGALTAFLIAAMTNPMLINFVGMSILGCLLVQWSWLLSTRPAGVTAAPAPEVRQHA